MHQLKKLGLGIALAGAATAAQAEWTANFTAANNYIWRGLTQTTNEPAISGGIDYAHSSGLYAGTWVSNVQYASDDNFSYEHDLYVGYAGEYMGVSYDFGYLYYNYDENAAIDFSEIYGSLGYMGFSVTAYILAHTDAEESDFFNEEGGEAELGFGDTFYLSADYGFTIGNGVDIGLHVGYHHGDFNNAFNFIDGDPAGGGTFDYFDYNASISKGGFSFMVTQTTVDPDIRGMSDGSGGVGPALQNDQVKFVVSYSVDFEL